MSIVLSAFMYADYEFVKESFLQGNKLVLEVYHQ